MIWLIELALVLILAGGVITYVTRGRRDRSDEERDTLTRRRVDAYIETIRRERTNEELAAMSDSELRDLLFVGARNMRIARARKTWVLAGAGLAILAGAIVAGSYDGLRGFGIAVAAGVAALYGLNEFLDRRIAGPLLEHGVDVERIKVE